MTKKTNTSSNTLTKVESPKVESKKPKDDADGCPTFPV